MNPIFVHIPKTGGGTIRADLGLSGPLTTGHQPYDKATHGERAPVMCVVRDPWDRAVSLYHHQLRGQEPTPEDWAHWVGTLGLRLNSVPIEKPCSAWATTCTWFGHFEEYRATVAQIASVFRVVVPPTLQEIHKAANRQGWDFYYGRDREINAVADYYREDILRFNYDYYER